MNLTSHGAPLPPDEDQRLRELRSADILDTEPEETLDRITRLASSLLETPIALVSLIDDDRQWFKSRVGLDVEQTPREQAFCAHAILGDETLVVDDALSDARFAENPLVVTDPKIRFYAGAPLITPSGFRLGTLCVIDVEPRTVEPERLVILQDLAALASREIELRKMARVDQLTGAFNRAFMLRCGEREFALARRTGSSAAVALIDVDRFKQINDTHGHGYGDDALRALADACRAASRESDWFGRLGGDEFALIMPDIDESRALAAAERVRSAVAEAAIGSAQTVTVTISVGVTCFPTGESDDFTKALERADAAMYRAKEQRNKAAHG
jgi:diguanylate cyclase (GGDEF)-like protein